MPQPPPRKVSTLKYGCRWPFIVRHLPGLQLHSHTDVIRDLEVPTGEYPPVLRLGSCDPRITMVSPVVKCRMEECTALYTGAGATCTW